MPQPTDTELVRCDNCGRYGWHETSRCPDHRDVPKPAGAITVDDWMGPTEDDPHDIRFFTGTSRIVVRNARDYDIEVLISGTQTDDGRIEREIVVDRDYDSALTPAHAREWAQHLIAAADECEQMVGYDPLRWATQSERPDHRCAARSKALQPLRLRHGVHLRVLRGLANGPPNDPAVAG